MKNTCLLLLLFTTLTALGQTPTQKDILELPNIDLKTDFKFNTTNKTPINISQKWFTLSENQFKHAQDKEYQFDKNSLKLKEYKHKSVNSLYHHWTIYSYLYTDNLLQEKIIKENDKVIESAYYLYDTTNRIIDINTLYGDFVYTRNYKYPNSSTIIKTSKKANTKTNQVALDQSLSFTLKNRLIVKREESKSDVGMEYVIDYKYDDANMLTEQSPYQSFMNVFQPSNSPTIGYSHNDSGYLERETSVTGIDDIRLFYFEYIYDDYGNWVAKFKVWKKDLYDLTTRTTTEIKIRTIEYNDKTTTGFTTINNPQIQEYLNQLKFASSSPPNDGVYWSKLNDKQFRFYDKGGNISGSLNYVARRGVHFYANDSITNTFYQVKDFDSKPIQKEYYKAIIIANNDDVLWHITEENNFYIIKNGQIISDSELVYAKNKTDIFMFLKTNMSNTPSYVLVNAENVEANIFQKAIPYSDYLKTHPNMIEEIPSGAIWKKADNGSFWFYVNGEVRSQAINFTLFGNHCVIYDLKSKTTYLLKDYKTEAVGKFLKAIPYTGNKFWFKSTPETFNVIINAQKIEDIVSADFTQNGLDVVTISKINQKEHVLKDYKNAPLFTLTPIINYSDYTEVSKTNNNTIGGYSLSEIKGVNEEERNYYKELNAISSPKERGAHLAKYWVNFTDLTKDSENQINFLKNKLQELLNIEFIETMNGFFWVGWNALDRTKKHYIDNVREKILLEGQLDALRASNGKSWKGIDTDPSTYPAKGVGWEEFMRTKN